MIGIYRTNVGEFERIKLKLSKYKDENAILNTTILTYKKLKIRLSRQLVN
jgi:hypothetical protein